MRYAVDFKAFDMAGRMALLEVANLDGVSFDGECIVDAYDRDMDTQISTGQREVWAFALNPATPINFSKLSYQLGVTALTLHYEFWKKKLAGLL